MPTTEINFAEFEGKSVLDMLVGINFIPSKGEGRRLVQQNGLSVNDVKVTDVNMAVTADLFTEDGLIVRKGKKVFHRIIKK